MSDVNAAPPLFGSGHPTWSESIAVFVALRGEVAFDPCLARPSFIAWRRLKAAALRREYLPSHPDSLTLPNTLHAPRPDSTMMWEREARWKGERIHPAVPVKSRTQKTVTLSSLHKRDEPDM